MYQKSDSMFEQPNPARMYDYSLGGTANTATDREAADAILARAPQARRWAWENRAFGRRVVRFLVEAGVRQFLDLGSGIPAVGAVHEVAQRLDPAVRVLYVDADPVAVGYARQVLAGNAHADVLRADLRDIHEVLSDPIAGLLDLRQPVALLALAVLHFVPASDDPAGIVAIYLDRLAAGSYLAVSHADTATHTDPAGRDQAAATLVDEVYARTATRFVPRPRTEIARLLARAALVPPGLVAVDRWRPDTTTDPAIPATPILGGVGII